MKKTIFVVALSIAGFIAVWRFEPEPLSAAAPSTSDVSTAPSTSPPSTSPPSTSSGASGVVTVPGSAQRSEFGTVQVQVTFTGSRITDVTLLQSPEDGRGQDAIPTLRQEALQAQSSHVDTVSGATQTSESYAASLQSAIDAKGA